MRGTGIFLILLVAAVIEVLCETLSRGKPRSTTLWRRNINFAVLAGSGGRIFWTRPKPEGQGRTDGSGDV